MTIKLPFFIAEGDTTNADKIQANFQSLLDLFYPVGAIFMSVVNTNPGTYLGGTWVAWGGGRVPVGVDTGQTEFDTVEETGGEKTHTLSIAEMPGHNHTSRQTYSLNNGTSIGINGDAIQGGNNGAYGGGATAYNAMPQINTGISGSDGSHNNLQPYICCFMWKRTS